MSILQNGSKWPLEDLDFDKRAKDLKEALEFGNHKGAEKQPELLKSLVEKTSSMDIASLSPWGNFAESLA